MASSLVSALGALLSIILQLYSLLIVLFIGFYRDMMNGTRRDKLTNGHGLVSNLEDFTFIDSDTSVRDAKDAVVNTMREEAESLRADLQSAQAHCRKLQRYIEKRNKEASDLKSAVASMKVENSMKKDEYFPCDEIRNRRWQEDSMQLKKLQLELQGVILEKKALQDAWKEVDEQFEDMAKVKDFYQTKANNLQKDLQVTRDQLAAMKAKEKEWIIEREKLKSQMQKMTFEKALQTDSSLVVRNDGLEARLKMTEEHYAEALRENQILQDKEKALHDTWKKVDEQLKDMTKMKDGYQTKTNNLQKDLQMAQDQLAGMKANQIKADNLQKDLQMARDQLAAMKANQTKADNLQKDLQVARDQLSALKAKEKEWMTEQEELKAQLKKITLVQEKALQTDSSLVIRNDGLEGRLKMTEERIGEIKRDNRKLQDELCIAMKQMEQMEEAATKARDGLTAAMDKAAGYKKEKDYFEKVYKTYKGNMEMELRQKDGKIAQQDKLITYMQCRIPTPKKTCCFFPDKRFVGNLTMDELGKALDIERAKNVDLNCAVRRLNQELREKRMRRSFSEERAPIASGD